MINVFSFTVIKQVIFLKTRILFFGWNYLTTRRAVLIKLIKFISGMQEMHLDWLCALILFLSLICFLKLFRNFDRCQVETNIYEGFPYTSTEVCVFCFENKIVLLIAWYWWRSQWHSPVHKRGQKSMKITRWMTVTRYAKCYKQKKW